MPSTFDLNKTTDSLWRVTFSNPPINLIDGAMIVELRELFDMTEKNEGPRVLLFESADRDYFLGGTLETHDFSAFA